MSGIRRVWETTGKWSSLYVDRSHAQHLCLAARNQINVAKKII